MHECMEAELLAFRGWSSAPVLDPRVAQRLEQILGSHPCFDDRHAMAKRRCHKRGGRLQRHVAGTPHIRSGRSTPAVSSERTIRSDLNKLAPANYASIARRLRFVASVDNLAFTFRTALEKAYIEPEHNILYINLFADILESLASEARIVAINVVRNELPTVGVIRSEALRPMTDPAKNYDAFCDACRIKRRLVGRSSTFASLLELPALSSIDATPLDVYQSHERVLRDLISDAEIAADSEIDSIGAVEIMIDSLAGVISRRNNLRRNFKEYIDEITLDAFPSRKCRFKIMDILGK